MSVPLRTFLACHTPQGVPTKLRFLNMPKMRSSTFQATIWRTREGKTNDTNVLVFTDLLTRKLTVHLG